MSAAQFKTAFDQREALRRIVLGFINAALSMAAQTAACNRRHSLEQRCARWLLNASDRIESHTMPMTQEFLASLLGARRAGVTETASKLQRDGLIHYQRGRLTILDRTGLGRRGNTRTHGEITISAIPSCHRWRHHLLQMRSEPSIEPMRADGRPAAMVGNRHSQGACVMDTDPIECGDDVAWRRQGNVARPVRRANCRCCCDRSPVPAASEGRARRRSPL